MEIKKQTLQERHGRTPKAWYKVQGTTVMRVMGILCIFDSEPSHEEDGSLAKKTIAEAEIQAIVVEQGVSYRQDDEDV